ncbi:MAG: flagellar basal body-associated FliL family protein, partial [Gemmatimonadaceae bacterium]
SSAPKSKMPMIIAIVAGLAVGGGSGAVVIGPMVARKMVHASVAVDTSSDATKGGEGAKGEHGEGGKGGAVAPPIQLLDNLVLNPEGSGGSRYLLMSIAIECVDAKGLETITQRDAELRDLILTTLSKKTVEDLSASHREKIKSELVAAIAAHFGKNSVKQLYFPQFVIQ